MSCQCAGCGGHFRTVGRFDAHRVGRHGVEAGPTRRRCLTTDEMLALGWRLNGLGAWVAPLAQPIAESRSERRTSDSGEVLAEGAP